MPQRSPLIFWLLLAATLCVDAVVFSLIGPDPFRVSVYASVAFHALILSQLSIVCTWSMLSARTWAAAYIAPIAAVFVAAGATVLDRDPLTAPKLNTYLSYYGFHAALLLATLWVLQRTQFWHRRIDTSREWRFSIAQLLFVTTVVAVLAAAMRHSPFFSGESKWHAIAWASSFVALSIVSVVIWSLDWHWLIRLACVLGFAIALAALLSVTIHMAFAYAHFLIQALVLSVWLDSGPIIPLPRAKTASGDA